jgi:transmembrane protein EpsG
MFVASTDYLSWMFNGMRQFIAVSIILISFRCLLNRHYFLMLLLILLAASIHGSALLVLPILLIIYGRAWNKKTILLLMTVIMMILFVHPLTDIIEELLRDTQYNDIVTNDIWQQDDGTNMLRVLFYSVPALFSLAGKSYIDEADSPLLNLCVNCSIRK